MDKASFRVASPRKLKEMKVYIVKLVVSYTYVKNVLYRHQTKYDWSLRKLVGRLVFKLAPEVPKIPKFYYPIKAHCPSTITKLLLPLA